MQCVERAAIDRALEAILDETCPGGGPVHDAMRYAVLGDGQRIRPILALRIAQLLRSDPELTMRAACATEILHCASLIVDDLPSMDNEASRRGRPATHIEFGEATALLAAFALVALAARVAVERGCPEEFRCKQQAFQLRLLRTLDCAGLIAGQSLDLTLGGDVRESNRVQLHELKTVPLFDLAVAAGAVYTRREMPGDLRRFGREFGVAFQIADDWLDGEIADPDVVAAQFDSARACLTSFGRDAEPLHELINYLDARVFEKDHCHR
jgi:geranylgeranyl pyrophosphate synthase